LWAFVSLAGIFVILSLSLVRPHDFWWHVRAGQWIVDNGRVPTVDYFSYTRAGEPYTYQNWLMEVAFYLLLRAGDLPLVVFFHAVVIAAAYGLLLRVSRRAADGDLRWAALATLTAAALGFDNWNVRPQTVSFLLFSLALYLIERHAARGLTGQHGSGDDLALWGLLPLFALWANCHGTFVFGLGLLGTYLAACLLEWLWRQRPFPSQVFLVTLLSAAATLLTPMGLGIVDYLRYLGRHSAVRNLVSEWMPPTIDTRSGALFFGVLAILVVLLLVSRYRPAPRESIRLLLFAGLTLTALRNTAWFGFVAAPTLAASLHHWAAKRGIEQGTRVGRPVVNLALAGLVGLLAFLSLPWFRPYLPLPVWRRGYVSPETPVQAAAALCSLPGTHRVFHGEGYGSYLIWACPDLPVFIDPRFELYPPVQWRDLLTLNYGRYDWAAILEEYSADTLLLQRDTQQPLIRAASEAPHWQRTYEDDQAVIFQRRGEP
jgi:hypothetical protein